MDAKQIKSLIGKYNIETVIAAGGDGTVNFIASSILGMNVNLGILPLGSANGLAYELGIPLKIEDAVQTLLTGKSQPIDAVRVNNNICLHLSDLGINARLIKSFEEEGKRGFLRYFKHFIKVLKTPRSFRCIIESEGKVYVHRALMTVIANAGGYRSGAVINPTGAKDDGRFEVIVIKHRRNWIVRNTIAAFTGNFHNQPNIETYECSKVKILVHPRQELQVDGELLGKSEEVRAEIMKHVLKVIVP